MSKIVTRWAASGPYLHSVLRIVSGFVFMLPGAMKILAIPVGMPPDGATAEPFTQIWIGGLLELIGGALMLVGLWTRPVAFLLSGEMAVAYFQFHFPQSPWPTVNNGFAAIMFCFVWLYFSAAGAGPWSLDGKRRR